MNILIHEGNIKVRWLAALARRDKSLAERDKSFAEDIKILPDGFPRYEQDSELAAALGARPSAFSNWFPDPPKVGGPVANRPQVEVVHNLARIFGFAPASDEDAVWHDWWANHWPSFMPSEDDKTNRREKKAAEDFKAEYRKALKEGHLTFRPPILASTTQTREEVPGGIVSPPGPSPQQQARTESAEPIKRIVFSDGQRRRDKVPVIIVGAVAIVLLIGALIGFFDRPRLSLSAIRIFDESYRVGPVHDEALSSLHPRKSNYYEITDADKFLLPIGFVITGYRTDPSGGIKLAITVTGLGDPRIDVAVADKGVVGSCPHPENRNPKEAWQVHYNFATVDDWKKLLVANNVGESAVLEAFSMREGDGIPVIAAIQCADPAELARWSGRIEVEVKDGKSDQSAHEAITMDLKRK